VTDQRMLEPRGAHRARQGRPTVGRGTPKKVKLGQVFKHALETVREGGGRELQEAVRESEVTS